MDEFEIIQRYFKSTALDAQVILGVGDDAALVRPKEDGVVAVSCDTLVAGTHFPKRLDPELIGHKALAVNLSDMAAMGAVPKWVTLCLTIPEANDEWLGGFSRGFFNIARHFGVQLIGGDMTRGALCMSVQILGEVDPALALTRRGAQPGDLVCVTGTLGDAGLGLAAYRDEIRPVEWIRDYAIARLHAPTPRVAEGQALLGLASAAIDISDGLVADLSHILQSSQVGATLNCDRLPLSSALQSLAKKQARHWALAAGDDYELCFTIDPTKMQELNRRWQADWAPIHTVGRIIEGERLEFYTETGETLSPPKGGYTHF